MQRLIISDKEEIEQELESDEQKLAQFGLCRLKEKKYTMKKFQATHSYSNDIVKWWTIANIDGYPQRVYVMASNAFEASNIFKSIYGDQLINEYASRA